MSQSIPNTFKITSVKTGENRRFPATKSFADLKQNLSSFWGEHDFVLTYQDEDGDVITVSTEVEFAEALTVAQDMNSRVLKFNAYRNSDELRESLEVKRSSCQQQTGKQQFFRPPAVHHGVVCDRSGMNPIIGPRYHVPGADYDLCSAEFEKLPETERVLFVKIDHPRCPAVPCDGGFGVKHPGMSCPRSRHCPRMGGRVMQGTSPMMPMSNMPPTLSVNDLILQASIAASLFEGLNHRDDKEAANPFTTVLSSFMDAAAVAAVNEATKNNGGAYCQQKQCNAASCEKMTNRCRGENPLVDILSGLRSANPSTTDDQTKSNCSGGGDGAAGGGGDGCPVSKGDARTQCQNKMREKLQKLRKECEGGGHPLGHLLSGFLDMTNQVAAGEDQGGAEESLPVHHGVECDKSGMNPIVGARYTILGANFDLCAEEFEKLPEAERVLYHKISAPGQSPIPTQKQPVGDDTASGVMADATAATASRSEKLPATGKHVPPAVAPVTPTTKKHVPVVEPSVPTTASSEKATAVNVHVNEDDSKKFENELLELALMGFVDRDTNLPLLRRYQGRVDRVINFILEL